MVTNLHVVLKDWIFLEVVLDCWIWQMRKYVVSCIHLIYMLGIDIFKSCHVFTLIVNTPLNVMFKGQ